MTKKKRKRLPRWQRALLIGILSFYGTWLIYTVIPPSVVELEVSRETTYLTGPLRPDGTVNYAAAVNRRNREGVTPENNAVVLILRAFGPDALPPEPMRSETYDRLDIDPLPAEGEYFVSLEDFPALDQPDPAAQDEERSRQERIEVMQQQAARTRALKEQLDQAVRRPWTAEEFPGLARWLEVNEEPLALLAEIQRFPRYFWPIIPSPKSQDLFTAQLEHLAPARLLSQALTARAMLARQNGRTRAAWNDLLTVQRLADRFARDDFLITRLVAAALRQLSNEGMVRLIQNGDVSAEQAAETLDGLLAIEPWPTLRAAFRFERLTGLDTIQYGYRSGFQNALSESPSSFVRDDMSKRLVDINRMMRRANGWSDRMNDALSAPTLEARHDQSARVTSAIYAAADRRTAERESLLFQLKLHFTPRRVHRRVRTDMLTDKLASFFASYISRGQVVYARAIAEFRMAKAALALVLYQLDRGEYPEALAALVPAYLPEVPIDPFTDAPLNYRREGGGYLLYSIGPDFTDDGGDPTPRDPEHPESSDPRDTVFRVE